MNKISFFSYWGGGVLGGPYVKPKVTIFFMELWPYDSADMYNKGKNNYQFSCKSPKVILFCIFDYSRAGGGEGWVPLQLTEWAQHASQLSTHLYHSTYKIWKQSVQDSLSNHVHKEISADVDAAA